MTGEKFQNHKAIWYSLKGRNLWPEAVAADYICNVGVECVNATLVSTELMQLNQPPV